MNEFETLAGQRLREEFTGNSVFVDMDRCLLAYEMLSDLVAGHITPMRTRIGNLSSDFFDSLAGTINSMKLVLPSGRIADA